MPEYLAPGVYVEEVDLGSRPIEGVSTSTAGFLGPTERGPTSPQLITNFLQFNQIYGGFLENSFLAYAVDGFFRNGGQRCFVGRIVRTRDTTPNNNAAVSSANLTSATTGGANLISVRAIGPGIWGDRVYIKVEDASLTTTTRTDPFKLTIFYWRTTPPVAPAGSTTLVDPTDTRNVLNSNRQESDVLEVYDNLSSDPTSSDYYLRRVNGASRLIELGRLAAGRPVNQGTAQEATLNGTNRPGTVLNTRLGAGREGNTTALADYQGNLTPGSRTGLAAFEEVDEIAIAAIPDEHGITGLTSELIDHCEKLKDRFAVTAINQGQTDIATLRPGRDTKYAAVYYPWIKIIDPVSSAPKLIPPTGQMMGIYARTDAERGVFKAPANEVVRGAIDLELPIGKGEQDILNPRGINAIRAFPARGIRVWGARTMSSDGAWKYINVRRLFIFLEESIDEATQYAVFEPNDISLWERLRGSVTAFLRSQWRGGALQGAAEGEAFFVKIGLGETMTQDDIDNGRIIMLIGVAPVKPAEFVIFRITQMPRGSTLAE